MSATSRRHRIVGLALTVTALLPAAAHAQDTITCIAPVGPGGQAMRMTLLAEAGHCPRSGEAIPAQLVVGALEPVGPAPGVAERRAAVASAVVRSSEARSAAPVVTSAALAAAARAVAAVAAARGEAPRASAAAPVESTADSLDVPQFTLPSLPHPSLGIALLALIGGAGLLAGPGGRVRWTA